MPTSILRLSGMGVPPYSARGLRETLEPVSESAVLRRTVNGVLHDLSEEELRKYQVTISGSDQQPPALEARWPGVILLVDCITELSLMGYHGLNTEGTEEVGTEAGFGREPVPGSIRHADGFTFYRPRLSMRVTGFSTDTGEFDANVSWTLNLEEV